MHSAGLKLTKLTYTRLEDNLIRHRDLYIRTWGPGFDEEGAGAGGGSSICAWKQ